MQCISLEESPHGTNYRAPFDFLLHDLAHAAAVWQKLTPPHSSNVPQFLNLIAPVIDLIHTRTSNKIIDTFLILSIHDNTYMDMLRVADPSSLISFF